MMGAAVGLVSKPVNLGSGFSTNGVSELGSQGGTGF